MGKIQFMSLSQSAMRLLDSKFVYFIWSVQQRNEINLELPGAVSRWVVCRDEQIIHELEVVENLRRMRREEQLLQFPRQRQRLLDVIGDLVAEGFQSFNSLIIYNTNAKQSLQIGSPSKDKLI